MNRTKSKKILLSPLDWGLGHTTRCIPLARHLEALGAQLFFAGNEVQCAFFQKTFPQIHYLPLKGYGVRYSKSRIGFLPKLLRQMPCIFRTIREEHQWLIEAAEIHGFDGILSDNRYGLWHPGIPSVFLTHQPGLRTGFGVFADRVFARLHQRLMSRFGAIWLVDTPQFPGLSGALAHPDFLPQNARYIGLLSQFEKREESVNKSTLLILLSGPEPQRSILSEKLWQQVQNSPLPVVFVEGKAAAPKRFSTEKIRWVAQLNTTELLPVLQSARYVVCRSGYSTLMDAAVLNLKLILIPTPGQTEQEYLGKRLFRNQQALCYRQEDFFLKHSLSDAEKFLFSPLGCKGDAQQFVLALEEWYQQL